VVEGISRNNIVKKGPNQAFNGLKDTFKKVSYF